MFKKTRAKVRASVRAKLSKVGLQVGLLLGGGAAGGVAYENAFGASDITKNMIIGGPAVAAAAWHAGVPVGKWAGTIANVVFHKPSERFRRKAAHRTSARRAAPTLVASSVATAATVHAEINPSPSSIITTWSINAGAHALAGAKHGYDQVRAQRLG